jgi:hypothetical protein
MTFKNIQINESEISFEREYDPGTWKLTTNHATSSYGISVLVDPQGRAYGPGDVIPAPADGGPGLNDELGWIGENATQIVTSLKSQLMGGTIEKEIKDEHGKYISYEYAEPEKGLHPLFRGW